MITSIEAKCLLRWEHKLTQPTYTAHFLFCFISTSLNYHRLCSINVWLTMHVLCIPSTQIFYCFAVIVPIEIGTRRTRVGSCGHTYEHGVYIFVVVFAIIRFDPFAVNQCSDSFPHVFFLGTLLLVVCSNSHDVTGTRNTKR